MNKFYKLALSAIVIGFTFTSCNKDDDKIEEKSAYDDGLFVCNEGTFGTDNASVTFIGANGKTQQDIFSTVNDRVLGDVLQSIYIDDDRAYLVVNNSNKIEIVDADTFKESGVIEDLSSPRYIVEEDGKLYISQWNKMVGVYDASSLTKIKDITVGSGPEGLISVNDEVWVANSGGWSTDNSISVIKTSDFSVSTITLDGDNPKKMVEDEEGDVWVLCSGKVVYNTDWTIKEQTASKLIEIDATTKNIKKTIKLSDNIHYAHLDINDDENTLYYGGGFGIDGIFEMSTSSTSAPTNALISGFFYGFSVGENTIYGTIAPDFTNNGTVEKYDSKGNKIATYEVGVGPNSATFND
jgi:hypothetical protein